MTKDERQEQEQAEQTLRRLMRNEMDGMTQINVTTAAENVITNLMKNQPLLKRVLMAYAVPIAHAVGLEVLRGQRQGPVVEMGDTITTRDAVKQKAAKLVARWERWAEYNGKHHVCIPKMTGPDLLAAAGWRRKVATTNANIAGWLEELAARVGELTVESVLTEAEITEIYVKHCGVVAPQPERELVEAAD